MTLARQVDLEEGGNGGGPSAHHSRDEDGHASSEAADHQQQHHQQQQQQHSGQQVYSMLTPTRYIMRSDLYNHKGELDDSTYDPSKSNQTFEPCPCGVITPSCDFQFSTQLLNVVLFSTARWPALEFFHPILFLEML